MPEIYRATRPIPPFCSYVCTGLGWFLSVEFETLWKTTNSPRPQFSLVGIENQKNCGQTIAEAVSKPANNATMSPLVWHREGRTDSRMVHAASVLEASSTFLQSNN
jgi:hypothetical protein